MSLRPAHRLLDGRLLCLPSFSFRCYFTRILIMTRKRENKQDQYSIIAR